jgi:hypothetical protein
VFAIRKNDRGGLPKHFAIAACRGSLPGQFAMAKCPGDCLDKNSLMIKHTALNFNLALTTVVQSHKEG